MKKIAIMIIIKDTIDLFKQSLFCKMNLKKNIDIKQSLSCSKTKYAKLKTSLIC